MSFSLQNSALIFRQLALPALWLLGSACICAGVYQWVYQRALADASVRATRQAAAFGLAVQNELEKYETLPFTMSLHLDVAQALLHPKEPQRIDTLNRYLSSVQRHALISSTYVVDAEGLTIAASNWEQPINFLGQHYGFRPYVREAMRGGVGRFFAIGTTTGDPGYFLAHPVYFPQAQYAHTQEPLGVLAIKINLEDFERYWTTADAPVVLLDQNGVIFLSNKASLKYRTFAPLSESAVKEIRLSRQYDGHELKPLSPQMLTSQRYVDQAVGNFGWRLRLFVHAGGAQKLAMNSTVAAALATCLMGLAVYSFYQRRAHARAALAARLALSEAASKLEQRIASRTGDLVLANTELKQRYGQLKQTEQLLRATQNELVQAGKLGMLGQMAAGMTHELSQPLAAIQAFSDNAVTFLKRADHDAARVNLEHISNACTRMSHIIKQLKAFARKSQDQVGPVNLVQAIQNSALLLSSDYAAAGAKLSITADHDAMVLGDLVRVEQVLINLLRNALDAVRTSAQKQVRVELSVDEKNACVRIVDSGPGLAPGVRERLFEPFFTTKPSGEGLGLGLAISSAIVQALNGRLLAGNAPPMGAEFRLHLPLCRSSF